MITVERENMKNDAAQNVNVELTCDKGHNFKYLAKFTVVKGELTNDADRKELDVIRLVAQIEGQYVVMRYNGKRVGLNDGRSKHNCQSMCVKKNATEARVYLYTRNKWS
jgi:hypothetical protein